MEFLIYWTAKTVVGFLQLLPLTWVARLGRLAGRVAYVLDGRHRRMALINLNAVFKDTKSPAEIEAIARENFRRLGESYCCAIKTAAMNNEQLRPHFEVVGMENYWDKSLPEGSRVSAVGHFGNFEIYARINWEHPEWKIATTYRALKPPSLNRILLKLRETSGAAFYERRTDRKAFLRAIQTSRLLIGLVSDQHASKGAVRVPFLGMDCDTSAAPAVLAQRYGFPLFTSVCHRLGLARWRVGIGDCIPTHEQGKPRPVEDIMRDVNEALGQGVLADPANWFWVHNRWRLVSKKRRKRPGKPRRTTPEPSLKES